MWLYVWASIVLLFSPVAAAENGDGLVIGLVVGGGAILVAVMVILCTVRYLNKQRDPHQRLCVACCCSEATLDEPTQPGYAQRYTGPFSEGRPVKGHHARRSRSRQRRGEPGYNDISNIPGNVIFNSPCTCNTFQPPAYNRTETAPDNPPPYSLHIPTKHSDGTDDGSPFKPDCGADPGLQTQPKSGTCNKISKQDSDGKQGHRLEQAAVDMDQGLANQNNDEKSPAKHNVEMDRGLSTKHRVGTDRGFETKRDAGTDHGFETKRDAGTDRGFETKRDAGTDRGFETKRDAGTDRGFETKRDAGADNGRLPTIP